MIDAYKKQVRLLLDALPEVAKETCFAMHGGTAINLFDVKFLLNSEGLTDEVKRGLLFGLVSSNRPTHEMLNPHLLDQRVAFENQFEGMSAVSFTYDEYEATRLQLIETILAGLNKSDKEFLLSVNRLTPDWSIYAYQAFPSVKWKLLNLEKFKDQQPDTCQQQLSELEKVLAQ